MRRRAPDVAVVEADHEVAVARQLARRSRRARRSSACRAPSPAAARDRRGRRTSRRRCSMSPMRAVSSGMAGEPSRDDAREPAEDGLRERCLPGQVLAVGRPRGRLGHARRAQRRVPVHVPVPSDSSSSSGWNCTPHARSPARKPSPEPAGERSSSIAAGREVEAVLVPVHPCAPGGSAPSTGSPAAAGSGLQRDPVEVAPRERAHACRRARGRAAARRGTRRARARRARPPRAAAPPRPPAPGSSAFCSPPSETMPSTSPRRGQRVALADPALVELRAGRPQRGPGMAEERTLEMVDDRDHGMRPRLAVRGGTAGRTEHSPGSRMKDTPSRWKHAPRSPQ